MNLLTSLRVGPYSRVAFTGSGGKSSALFRLGREYLARKNFPRLVMLAATTHLAIEQVALADRRIIVKDTPPDEREIARLEGLVLFTGPDTDGERTAGVPLEKLDALFDVSLRRQIPFLIEADGSRQRPLKAPAPYEPVVPIWVDTVVVVAGLSALHQPFSAEWVHRPERFGALAEISIGEPITFRHIARVLNHPAGGLQGIPEQARSVALLNQAGSPDRQSAAQRLAELLLPNYSSVVVADLPAAPEKAAAAEENEVRAVHERTAGIILAAGAAQRFGALKQVLEWQGEPLVRRVALRALSAGLSPVIAVTGNAQELVQSALEGLPVACVYNADWRSGQASSVRTGVQSLPPEVGGAVFLLADQPGVTPALLRGLVEVHAAGLNPIVAPLVDDRRANPVLFDRLTFEDLGRLTGDTGGRALFSRYPLAWLPWNDRSVLLDIDTPEDYQAGFSAEEQE